MLELIQKHADELPDDWPCVCSVSSFERSPPVTLNGGRRYDFLGKNVKLRHAAESSSEVLNEPGDRSNSFTRSIL